MAARSLVVVALIAALAVSAEGAQKTVMYEHFTAVW